MKVMALDYGDARTGVAVSDPSGMIVGFTTVVAEWNREKAADKVAALVKEKKPERLVMGFPKNMDGTEGPRAALYREFAEMLRERTGMDVVLWDEKNHHKEHNILSAGGKKMKSHRKNVDAVAASLILEGYLSVFGHRVLIGVFRLLFQLGDTGEQQKYAEQPPEQRQIHAYGEKAESCGGGASTQGGREDGVPFQLMVLAVEN